MFSKAGDRQTEEKLMAGPLQRHAERARGRAENVCLSAAFEFLVDATISGP